MLAVLKMLLPASVSTLNVIKTGKYDKQDIVTNINFEDIIPSSRKYFYHQRMVDFVNKI